MQLTPGTVVGPFVVEDLLGEGGMAVVYRVRHGLDSTRHALKVLTLKSPEIERRLVLEGKYQSKLKHPHVVAATHTVSVDGTTGLVMEFVQGPSLDHWLANYRPTLDEALVIFRGIVSGVGAAHAAGLVHRDLKPGNVMLSVEPKGLVPKVADFGLAKAIGRQTGHATRTGTTMGTPHYMAPEQIRDASKVDRRADMYSLGVILFELVCGRPPYISDDVIEVFMQVATGDRPKPQDIRPDLPDFVVETIEALMDVDMNHRLADCSTLLEVLDRGDPELLHITEKPGELRPAPHISPTASYIYTDSPGVAVAEAYVKSLHSVPPRLPQPKTLPLDDEEEDKPAWGVWIALGALLLLLGIGGAMLVSAGSGALVATALQPTTPVPVEPAPVVEPLPSLPTPGPEAAPEPEPAPTPQPVSSPRPEPIRTAPIRPIANPRPTPRPETPVPAEPRPIAPPPVVPKPKPPAKARFAVEPAGTEVVAVDQAGTSWPPGMLPPGTYRVRVHWQEYGWKKVGTAEVKSNGRLVVSCQPGFMTCELK